MEKRIWPTTAAGEIIKNRKKGGEEEILPHFDNSLSVSVSLDFSIAAYVSR